VVISVALAALAWNRETERAQELLSDHGQVFADAVDEAFHEVVERLVAVGAFYQGSEEVTEAEFQTFVANFESILGMGGIGYMPVIERADLDAYQEHMAAIIPDYFVFEFDEEGNRVPVQPRSNYIPVQWFEPADAFDRPHGFDSGSEPIRRAALAQAQTTGEATATSFLQLVSESERDGFLVYRQVIDPDTGDLVGFTVAPMDLEEMLDGHIPAALSDDLSWSIEDLTTLPIDRATGGDDGWFTILDVGGRRWGFRVAPTEGSQFLPDRSRPLITLVAGVAISVLAAAAAYLQRRKSEAQQELYRLRELARAKDQFLASVSHELRTPLTGVLGFAELLRDNPGPLSETERRKMISNVADEASELASIIDDLLVAARAELDLLAITSVPVSLPAQLAQVLEASDHSVRERINVLDAQIEDVRALGDPGRVRQIIRNLVTNACRYGGPHIEVRFIRHNATVFLEVADDGAALPETEWERIFEPYHRAHGEESQPAALGIGLSVSRHLARLMNGELAFRRERGWNVFELALPVLATVEADDAVPARTAVG
jgi:signal transduction histidine kinase